MNTCPCCAYTYLQNISQCIAFGKRAYRRTCVFNDVPMTSSGLMGNLIRTPTTLTMTILYSPSYYIILACIYTYTCVFA